MLVIEEINCALLNEKNRVISTHSCKEVCRELENRGWELERSVVTAHCAYNLTRTEYFYKHNNHKNKMIVSDLSGSLGCSLYTEV